MLFIGCVRGSVGRNVDETLRLVKAFQHTDKHGEVCPINWQPGQKTVRPPSNIIINNIIINNNFSGQTVEPLIHRVNVVFGCSLQMKASPEESKEYFKDIQL
jgi:hypothetical protein